MKTVKIVPRPTTRQRRLDRLFQRLNECEKRTQKARDAINRFILSDRLTLTTDD
jgi:hypothetical protein